MKPSFALNFTDESVSLLHRAKRGWLEIGNCRYDAPDLAETMALLRRTALGLAPQGLATKLVIPASQMRYFEIAAPGPGDAARRAQIAAALEGRTPYAVEDLVFDWSGEGPVVTVAVVARETLDEAEAFATQHRFAPLSFVARPEDGTFSGEPWFGPTGFSASLLSGGDSVERDDEAITILTRAHAPEAPVAETLAAEAPVAEADPAPARPDPVVEPPADPEPPAEPGPDPVEEPGPQPEEPAPVPLPDPVREPEPLPEPEPVPPPRPADVPPPPAEQPDPEPLQVPQPDVTPDPAPDLPPPAEMPGFDPMPEPVTMETVAEAEAPVAEAKPEAAPKPAPEVDEAPMALDVEEDEAAAPASSAPARPKPLPGMAKVTENALTIEPDEPAHPTFTSRRVPALAGATAAAAQSMARRLGAAARNAAPLARGATPAATPPRREPKFGYAEDAPAPAAAPAAKAAPAKPSTPTVTVVRTPAPAAPATAAAATTPATPPPIAPPAAPSVPRPAQAAPIRRSPRSLTAAPARGKPRYLGLVLTGLLLMALAIAAALSSYYSVSTDPAETGAEPNALAAADPNAATATPVPAEDAALPTIDDEMLADGQDPEELADPSGTDVTAADLGAAETAAPASATAPATAAPATTTPAPAPAADPAPALAEAAPAAQAPATAAPTTAEAPAMQSAARGNDEIYLSATDTAPAAVDAAALPVPEARGDPAPTAPLPPPAFGTVYKFDANGRIIPTPEGITTPEGVLLTAGKPPVVPPQRPADLAPAAATGQPASSEDPAQTSPADPALQGKRPAPRPATLAATAEPAADAADPNLAPLADSRLAGLRPQARPASIAPVDPNLALVAPQGGEAPLGGLALSPRPAARPTVLASAVEAAVAAAAAVPAEPEPAPATAETAIIDDGNVTPETEQEPELASAAPSIPTKANVAREATTKNVLNLGKLNLIGVYGTQSNRYALVRQPNGRIVKVSAGDRLDGGRVAAVTATEVRYQKRGQMLVLAMPRG